MKNVLTFILLALVYSQAFAGYTGPNPNFNSVGIDTSIIADEIASPTTPASNTWKLYFKSTGLFAKDDLGTEYDIFNPTVSGFVPTSRTITTTAPLLIDAGASADLSANRTLSMPVATSSVDGYLDNADWTTFNDKIGKSGTYVDNCVMRSDGTTNLAQCGSGVTLDDSGNFENVTGLFTGSVNANLILDMVSTTKAARPCPTMTTVQRDALTAQTGSCIYNSTTSSYQFYNGTSWGDIGGGVSAATLNASRVYFRAVQADTDTCWDADSEQFVTYETESYDTNNIHSSSTITIPVGMSGVWYIQACADVTSAQTGCYQLALENGAGTNSFYARGDCFTAGNDDAGVQTGTSCVQVFRTFSAGNEIRVQGLGADNIAKICGTSSTRNFFEAVYYGNNAQF